MEIPAPIQLPIRKIRVYLENLHNAVLGIRPIAGEGIRINEYPGQGTVISTDQATAADQILSGLPPGTVVSTLSLDVCVEGESETHTFLVIS